MQCDREAEHANATGASMIGDGLSIRDLGQRFEDGLSARMLLSSIRRHLAIILAFTLSLCAAGALVGLGLPAWYKAEGVLVIRAVPRSTAEIQELSDPAPDVNFIQSQVDILQSRSVTEPVVRSLRLWEAPEFQKTEYPKGWNWQIVQARLGETWRDIWGLASGPEDSSREQPIVNTQPSDTNPPTQAQIDATVEAYAGYLTANNDGRSMTIHVTYRALTPERAAAVVNAHIDSYRNLEVKAKVTAAEHANSALTSQVAELRPQLQAAEMAVTRYREEHHLTGAAKDSGGVSGQLTALNSQLIAARAELAENEARAAGIVAGAASDSLPEVVASGTISGLRGQEVQLTAHEADLSKYHGDEYPELQRVRASLQNVRGQISRQIGRDRAAALQVVERSRTRERSLQQSITELTKQLNSADAGLQQLQGKADSIRSLLLSFEKRIGETAANPAFITPNSTIASRANSSAASTSSQTKMLALAGGFVGLTFGSLLSLLLELRDKGFRTSAQVQQHMGSLTVSATPRAVGRQRRSPADIILSDNRSAFAEAFRIFWANIQLAVAGPTPASAGRRGLGTALGITSAVTGDGKSVHALGLARTAALAGENVVLVDADLRRSGVSRLLDQDFCLTLGDFLQDRCTANDVVAIEERSGVHFVASAPTNAPWTNQEFQRFFNLIDYLKNRFALVIVDLPPILGLAETIRLAMAVDSLAFVVRWGRTERHLVQSALESLRTANTSTVAVVLNDIDLKAQRRRGYRDHTLIYSDAELYRTPTGYREPVTPAPSSTVSMAAAGPDAGSEETDRSEPQTDDAPRIGPRTAGSAIERWYDQYRG
jgi:succinoglycan biosynthesis transport protein ExoP